MITNLISEKLMPIQFHIEKKYLHDLTVSSQVPPSLHDILLPNAQRSYTEGGFGNFLSQALEGGDYEVCEYRAHITKKVRMFPKANRPMLTLVYVLRGTICCILKDFGEVILSEGKYYFFYVPEKEENSAFFEPGDFVFFHICMSAAYLSGLSEKYEWIKEVIRMQQEKVPSGIHTEPLPITSRAWAIIEQIKQCGETGSDRDIFMCGRIYDLLLIFSKDHMQMKKIKGASLAGSESKYAMAMQKAKSIVDSHNGAPLHIGELSRMLGVNSQVMKTEFKRVFRRPVYTYQLQLRMDMACDMLVEQQVSVQYIADEIGYKNPSSFIKKFKELFGMTPLKYRRKYGDK
ncbi:MAG: helix-turn-helix transcriptional regulator [Chitinophagaceae bacterium]|nr:helix-turn-helix transcriptional regulator [Chitinophagaceae bacterium]